MADRVAGFHQPVHEIVGGRLGVPARIAEADEIGQGEVVIHYIRHGARRRPWEGEAE